MNKIFEFVKNNVTSIILVFILYCYIKRTKETMVCDLKRPKYNYFFKESKHLIEKYKLGKEIFMIKSIFDISKKSIYKLDGKTILEFIKLNDFMDKKDNIISLVNELLNSNRIWNDTKDYKIDENTKISELRHIWLMDKLLTDLQCGFDSKKILMKIKKVLDEKPLKMCDKNELLKYCSYLSSKPKVGKLNKDKLEEEYIYLINDEMKPEMEEGTPLNNFKLESLEKYSKRSC